jgi:hypothetical protein
MKVGGSKALNDTWQLFGNMSYSAMTPSLDKLIDDNNYIGDPPETSPFQGVNNGSLY